MVATDQVRAPLSSYCYREILSLNCRMNIVMRMLQNHCVHDQTLAPIFARRFPLALRFV
jgi:hypothetical protein